MYTPQKRSAGTRALMLVLAVMVGMAPSVATAATVTSFAIDPTCDRVYYQFSTDRPFDAYRVIVREIGGPFVGVRQGHPHYSTTGVSGVVTGLPDDTPFRIVLKIRWVHGGPWQKVRKAIFTTNPC